MNLLRFCVLFALICVAFTFLDPVSIARSKYSQGKLAADQINSMFANTANTVNCIVRKLGYSRNKCVGSGSAKVSTPTCSNHGTLLDKVICSCAWVDNISQCNSTAAFDPRKYQLNQNIDSKLVYSPGADYPTLTEQVNINCDGSTPVKDQTSVAGVLCALGCICIPST